MAMRYSFGMGETADRLEAAIAAVLNKGLRTADIFTAGSQQVGTTAMGDALLAELGR
jgi:3-isopropylmalate dehydrogenase